MSSRSNLSSDDILHHYKNAIRSNPDAEKRVIIEAGLKSIDELSPEHFKDLGNRSNSKRKQDQISEKSDVPASSAGKSQATKPKPHQNLQLVGVHMNVRIDYEGRYHGPSTYQLSCHAMDFIVHKMNNVLNDTYYFRRSCPLYHAYILRLYFGILFWIQGLRASRAADLLTDEQEEFLSLFLGEHTLTSLSIPGFLLPLFKSICASQPDLTYFGKVAPNLPAHPGPALRSDFISDDPSSHFLPNIPGIFALLTSLNAMINNTQQQPVYPKKEQHIPVTDQFCTFGFHNFAAQADRPEKDKWALVSPGLQYPCESDQELNKKFSEHYSSFCFPETNTNDNLTRYKTYFGYSNGFSWFWQLKEVALAASKFFRDSGTLADCPPNGYPVNQVQVKIATPPTLPTAPTKLADRLSLYPLNFMLTRASMEFPEPLEPAAAFAMTNIEMFSTHPFYPDFNVKTEADGEQWQRRPVYNSRVVRNRFSQVNMMLKQQLKQI